MNLFESHQQKKLSKAISLAEEAGYVKAEAFKEKIGKIEGSILSLEKRARESENELKSVEERIERKFANFADRIKRQLLSLEKSVNETCEMAQLKRELLVVKSFENRIKKLEKPVLINGRKLTNNFKFTVNDLEYYHRLEKDIENLKKKYTSFSRNATRNMNECLKASEGIKKEMNQFSSVYKSMLRTTKNAGKIAPTKKQ